MVLLLAFRIVRNGKQYKRGRGCGGGVRGSRHWKSLPTILPSLEGKWKRYFALQVLHGTCLLISVDSPDVEQQQLTSQLASPNIPGRRM